ncbi:DUF305 domain-containing protein [Sphaerisporangium perillae]|uniref:DUF305 domain-containing protein n=1 Tax=Sphaerisporangium perillae TaxID=2935860 RepID=UPI00200E1F07|nr:DUF305 domain-containing protein [Sphaerisporangium perillae]
MKRLIIASTALAAAGLLATGCGGQETASGHGQQAGGDHGMSSMASPTATPAGSSAGSPSADHNDQDVMFAQMMIPHHRQAIDMAKLADSRASSPEVKQLAKQIEAAQEPEITTMSGWLTAWSMQVPGYDMSSMGHGMDGMMSADEMKELDDSSGSAFDKAFLTMMIKHHEGAVSMAKKEQSSGAFPPAHEMAAAIVTSQTAEIGTMKQLLRSK